MIWFGVLVGLWLEWMFVCKLCMLVLVVFVNKMVCMVWVLFIWNEDYRVLVVVVV